jgi:hypothetical protein
LARANRGFENILRQYGVSTKKSSKASKE